MHVKGSYTQKVMCLPSIQVFRAFFGQSAGTHPQKRTNGYVDSSGVTAYSCMPIFMA